MQYYTFKTPYRTPKKAPAARPRDAQPEPHFLNFAQSLTVTSPFSAIVTVMPSLT